VLVGAALSLSFLIGPTPAWADSLSDGISEYTFKNYDPCIGKLRAVLYPPTLSKDDANKAREYLAACYFGRWLAGKMVDPAVREESKREAKNLLFEDPDYVLKGESGADFDPAFTKFFEEVRDEYRDDLKRLEAKRHADEAALEARITERVEARFASMEPRVYKFYTERERLLLPHFIPIVGQLYNRDYLVGAGFLVFEAAALTVATYTFVSLHTRLRFDCTTTTPPGARSIWGCPPNYAPPNDSIARVYRAINLASVLSAFVIAGVSIAHAAIRGRPTEEMVREMTTAEKVRLGIWKPPGSSSGAAGDSPPGAPPETPPPPAPAKKPEEKPKLFLVPLETPPDAGASLGLGLELRF
jgi:hypothetical protein